MCLLAALLIAGGANTVSGQGSPRLQEVDVSLWPEYDRPSVLVMYRITLAPQTSVPARLQLRIPAAVGTPTAVAEAEPGGNLVNASYERRVDGDRAVLEIDVTRPRVQVEYYDPRLERQESRRTFVYSWPGMEAAEALEVTVQEPVGARELTVTPAADRVGEAADGLVYHTLSFSDPTRPTTVRFEYLKDTDALSVESLPPMSPANPTAPGTPPATGAGGTDDVPAWLLAAVVAAAAAGIGGWWLSRRRAGSEAPGAGSPADATSAPGGRRYCTQCGGPVGSADKFCASCGQRLAG